MKKAGAVSLSLLFACQYAVAAQPSGAQRPGGDVVASHEVGAKGLPPIPDHLPRWMTNYRKNHIFYKRGRYNFDIYNIKPLAYDLNAVAVGHAMAYEDMVTGKSATLDATTFDRINWVLTHPPKLMPDEGAIAPTFGRTYGVLEQVFDWTHVLHAQTADVLASTQLTDQEKDKEIQALWKFYFNSVPYSVTSLPMNMGFLDGQPYSGAFRKKYPKVNGLFWGYHWLQGIMYDVLMGKTLPQKRQIYQVIGDRYRKIELYRTDRPFMPMFAETSPRFSQKYPDIANAFDNLHMLHDMVNDILASDWIPEVEKEKQILRAIWLVSAEAHKGEKSGDSKGEGTGHDHRFMVGMPGMGIMKHGNDETMWMDGMGWMTMADCHHCSTPLPEGKDAWRAPTVTAQGWTMRVRCPFCARDMASETKGRVVMHIPTENPQKPAIVISDQAGDLTTDTPEVVFLDQEGGHAKCNRWSQAFTSLNAFNQFVSEHQEYAKAKPVPFKEWAELHGKKPDTYIKPEGPHGPGNPYETSSGTMEGM